MSEEINDCLDWLKYHGRYLPKKRETLRYYKTIKDLKNVSVGWGFSPEGIMSEYLYETGQLEEFAVFMKQRVHEFYLSAFATYYIGLKWWSMFIQKRESS